MSENFDGRKSPFDLFGPPAPREGDGEDPGIDLSKLMREEAGRPPEEPATFEPQPGPDFAEDPDEDLPVELSAAPVEEAAPVAEPTPADGPLPAGPEAVDATAGASAPEAAPVEPAPEASVVDAEEPAAIAAAERAPETVRQPLPVDTRQLWLLRVLLVGNLVMMLVMLVLPHPLEPRAELDSPGAAGQPGQQPRVLVPPVADPAAEPADPFLLPRRERSLGLPDDAVYERALLLALDGDFDAACSELQGLLAKNPDMNPAVARLVHAHLAYYLRKAGRLTEAIEHERLARQETDRSSLPEELLEAARAAEARGDGEAMRRAYARFLLQESQLPPDMRAMVFEVLTKLGDSYRVQADAGEARSEERSR